MRLKFLGKYRPVYNHPQFTVTPNEITPELDEAEGQRILADFPNEFIQVDGGTKMVDEPPFNKLEAPPQFNKKRGRPRKI